MLQCLTAGHACRQEIAAGDWWGVRDLLRQAKDLSSKRQLGTESSAELQTDLK